jgi:hypothetical protein
MVEMGALIARETVVVGGAYLLTAIPVGAAVLAGHLSPLYRMSAGWYLRCWSRLALVFVAAVIVVYRLIPAIA